MLGRHNLTGPDSFRFFPGTSLGRAPIWGHLAVSFASTTNIHTVTKHRHPAETPSPRPLPMSSSFASLHRNHFTDFCDYYADTKHRGHPASPPMSLIIIGICHRNHFTVTDFFNYDAHTKHRHPAPPPPPSMSSPSASIVTAITSQISSTFTLTR